MIVKISKSFAKGALTAPPSKSYSHRALIAAAFCENKCEIDNIVFSDDIEATAGVLRALGAEISVSGKHAVIKSIDTLKRLSDVTLFCNESGSTLRFLIPATLLVADRAEFKCNGRLIKRPQSVYEEVLPMHGCSIEKTEHSVICGGKLKNGVYFVRGDISSQFMTGFLMALPLTGGDSSLTLVSPLKSTPYVDITLDVMRKFGIAVSIDSFGNYKINGNQKYSDICYTVEGDWSNAAYIDAFNMVGGSVKLDGLLDDSRQGDKIYREYFRLIKNVTPVIDVSDCPDLSPVLMVLAAVCGGALLKGTERLKIKESDRGEAMREELVKFGADIEILNNSIVIRRSELHAPACVLSSHHDHRVAMALALMCSIFGGEIEDPECVSKSYPDFWDDLKQLGIDLEFKN